MKIFILILFLLTYVGIVAFNSKKTLITGVSAFIGILFALIFGATDFNKIINSIDINVVMILVGTMLTVSMFSISSMPNKIADKLIKKFPSALLSIIFLCVLSGVVSAFIDNVATVLMLCPIGLAVANKSKTSPVPIIISIAVCSNLQGAATLVGDTTSVMLGSALDMSFTDFFFFNGRFSIFWAVELGALFTLPVLFFIFRKEKQRIIITGEEVKISTYFPSVMLILTIALLIGFSFIDKPFYANGLICLVTGVITFVYTLIKLKLNFFNSLKDSIDYQTVLFLIFLFLIIGLVENVGIISSISDFFINIGNLSPFLLYTVIVFGSVVLSAFIDNIPFVATMLPVISGIPLAFPLKVAMNFGLLIGATLGGNLSPVGASANVVGIGVLKKEGYNVKPIDFFKIGIPITLIATLVGYGFIWLIWGL